MPLTNFDNKHSIVFSDPAYPEWYSQSTLSPLLPDHVLFVDAAALTDALEDSCELFISFHGPYFPKDAWPALLAFLERGGNIAVFGGMPFTRPVRADGTIEAEQQAYTRQLFLGPFFELKPTTTELQLDIATEAAFISSEHLHLQTLATGNYWSFYPKLTQVSDQQIDLGSAGPFDTILTPLLYVDEAEAAYGKNHFATIASLLDQQSGQFRGGRWLLSPWKPADIRDWLALDTTIQKLIQLATQGSTVLQARSLEACYQPGETATIVVSARSQQTHHVTATLHSPQGQLLQTWETRLAASTYLQESRFSLPEPLHEAGLYQVRACFENEQGIHWQEITGFWYWDKKLVEASAHLGLEAGRDYFYQQGAPFPLYGTTYMDSNSQRKFLIQPDAARWNNDFAQMKTAGVNVIRTGIWTAWRDLMPIRGQINASALRALDAFVMTACTYQIQVIFTFFTFYPPLFDGVNPWLDPRSLQAQQDFVSLLAGRYAGVQLLSWDLINEPSFGAPEAIFSERSVPNYDRFELTAFQDWLAERYSIAELQQRWRQTPADFASWDQVSLPVAEDYVTDPRITNTRNMLKVMDYTFFSQDMFTRWASIIYQAIRAAGSTTLIGVGQDEARSRISPQFYAPAMDYSTTHPWWNYDEMLCDMLLDKHIARPNLIQEIGVMLVRDVDMRPLRTEEECAALLERKLITGLIARGAGLIQWLWHTNAYMTSDNENSIGLVRTDGSAKPELRVFYEIGRLMQELSGQIIEPENVPETWVIIPYSQWFLRPALGVEATQQAIRILGYDLDTIPQMVGEHQLATLLDQAQQPQTIILPGLQYLSTPAWQALLTFVERGATLLVSGVLGQDQHNLIASTELEDPDNQERPTISPVARYEQLQGLDGQSYQFGYTHDKMAYIKKAHNSVRKYTRGQGRIVWSGIPIEQSHHTASTRAVYQQALGIVSHSQQQDSPYLIARQPLKNGTLILIVSEHSQEGHLNLDPDLKVSIAPNRAGAILTRNDGTTTSYGGVQIL
ncbi:hypothetical protein KDA_58250 [Dictyobacter alpinus]|uniref:Glycoside hydrolase family 42 N-terminal domain-containing protein n=1 Tax=Dictyobacter alpinus TaxID=2014873 RepID=A0A402BG62_9CHLR|nr:alpha-amylase family protein [Dictyobacter alpinus]GCE30309.1 hypothetical protein KDA_57930 [Dictyobacter alpinus]GCE30341.1 hypothetical protein KDA_58250 [Dictyobacter alpinus]